MKSKAFFPEEQQYKSSHGGQTVAVMVADDSVETGDDGAVGSAKAGQ